MTAPTAFRFDPTAVQATIEVLPKGEYEFVVGEPKSFKNTTKKGANAGKENFGVRYPVVVAEGESKGKRIFVNLFMHSEGAQPIAKQFLMAAAGFQRNEAGEKAFNEAMAGKDWNYNPENGTAGDAWHTIKGSRVRGALDVGLNPDDPTQKQQVFVPGCWSPVS